jgi:hypothetical protein
MKRLLAIMLIAIPGTAFAVTGSVATRAAGSTGQVQFNNGGGRFGGDTNLSYSSATKTMSVPKVVVSTLSSVTQVNFADGTTQTTASSASGGSGGSANQTVTRSSVVLSQTISTVNYTSDMNVSVIGGTVSVGVNGNIFTSYSTNSVSYLGISSTPWTSTMLSQSTAPVSYLGKSSSTITELTKSSASVSYLGISSGSVISATETITGPKTFSNYTTFSGTVDVAGVRPVLRVKAINTGDDAVLRLDNNNNGDRSFVDFFMAGSRRWVVGALGSTTKLSFSNTFLAGSDILALNIAQLTASSSTGSLVAISGTWNQSSTAGGTDLLVNRYESAIGSGAQLLADFQVASTSKFSIDRTGFATAAGGFSSTANSFFGAMCNTSTANNARIRPLSTGTLIDRNIGDQNPVFGTNQVNAGSTGDLANFQFNGVAKASVTANGGIVISSAITSSGSLPIASTNTPMGMVGTVINGQGSAITSGSTVAVTIPYDCTITSATVIELSGTSGSISVDVKRITYSSFVDYTSFVSIVGAGGNKPGLTSQQTKAITPTSWTSTQLLAGDILAFVVDSASSVKLVSVTLWTRKN